jgi:uncharacterized membrane protein YcaP (DUF421 family)
MIINMDVPFIYGVIAIITFGVISYIVSLITMNSLRLRKIFNGTPTIVIQNGKILINNLKKVKMDVNDLLEQIRIGGFFDLSEVEYAIVETNEKLSIMPKVEYAPLTPKDMNIKIEKNGLIANVVIDSIIIKDSLFNMHKDINWLKQQLKIKGYRNLNNILLATLDINDKLNIYEKNTNIEDKKILE